MSSITVDLTGLPEVKRLLEEFTGSKLNNRMRRGLRAGVKVFRTEMRSQAQSRPDLPKTFAKTRTRAHRNPLGVSVSPGSPLSTIFEHGAGTHVIAPKSGGILTNADAGDPSASGEKLFFSRRPVNHPGMDARPLIVPVFDASHRRAEDEFGRVVFEGLD